ncbi:hypothetical protein H4R34_002353 [Dimargaris verticillata]|uniref:Methyltransferase domain-containing protein n=1 Tax=Dimargaris verticillata TaxID=2761393 RepID=A0A9W8B4B7_9FUNG|nr:hypothetical protein H4R34_002353 [Dimargaris verticillata]
MSLPTTTEHGLCGYQLGSSTREIWRARAAALSELLAEFRWLVDMHIVDFFVQNAWAALPGEWQSEFDTQWDKALPELVDLASGGQWRSSGPASLHQFINACHTLALDRSPGLHSTPQGNRVKAAPCLNSQVPPLDSRILPGMNPKKVEEVASLAFLVSKVARKSKAHLIADVGAGQGYLSRALAYQYHHAVLAIDGDSGQTRGAQQWQKSTAKRVHSVTAQDTLLLAAAAPGLAHEAYLRHVTCRIDSTNLPTVDQLVANVQTRTAPLNNSCAPEVSPQSRWVVCGLHACGNLSVAMLQWFVETNAQALIIVGCCYNLMKEEHGSEPFPLCHSLATNQDLATPHFLKLACQAPMRWSDQISQSIRNFDRNFYRALLHYVMIDQGLVTTSDPFPVVGRMRSNAFQDFPTYCRRALSRLGHECISETTLTQYYDTHAPSAYRLAVVWTLRALLAPCIESLILLDRCLYLVDKGCAVSLIPLCDAVVSPRNMVIVATKST